MKNWLFGLAVLAGLGGGVARAADHRDGPAVSADPSTDINDVYAWMSADANKLYLAMTVSPNATAMSKFSDAALYVFHVNAYKMFGDTKPNQYTVICRFDAAQKIECWGPENSSEFVAGDASAAAGISTASGKLKVFAGPRDDAFFFNIAGFRNGIATAKAALMNDPMGCPKAAEAVAPGAVTALLSKGPMGGAPADGFKKGGDAVPNYSGNVLAIVIALDKTTVTDADHKLLGVWGSTNKKK